jgi:adenylate kinase
LPRTIRQKSAKLRAAKRIGITGSPGTGKKSVAKELSKLLGYEVISLNKLAIRKKLGRWERRAGNREFEVDLAKLRKEKINTEKGIIVGHLLPYVVKGKSLDFVAVLRCSPNVLRKRYRSRHYDKPKTEENLLAETLDIISFDALRVFGKDRVAEFDSTRSSPRSLAKAIVETIFGKRRRGYGKVAWSIPHAIKRNTVLSDKGERMRAKKARCTKKVISIRKRF